MASGDRRILDQEWLKLIACGAMLADHIGAVLLPWSWLRILGRIAFPIFCFLLCEGVRHTRDPRRYALRLGIGALLSELPFDLLFSGGWDPERSSVMVTLLIGFFVALCIRRRPAWRIWALIAGVVLAELTGADYGGMGILLIGLFALDIPGSARSVAMALLFLLMGGQTVGQVPIQIFGLLSLIPIGMYSGRKRTDSRMAQWAFYLFYPVHLWILVSL